MTETELLQYFRDGMEIKELCRVVLGYDDIAHIQPEGKDKIFISRWNNPATIISLDELWCLVDKNKHQDILNITESVNDVRIYQK